MLHKISAGFIVISLVAIGCLSSGSWAGQECPTHSFKTKVCPQYCCVDDVHDPDYVFCCTSCHYSFDPSVRNGPSCKVNSLLDQPLLIVAIAFTICFFAALLVACCCCCCRRQRTIVQVVERGPDGAYYSAMYGKKGERMPLLHVSTSPQEVKNLPPPPYNRAAGAEVPSAPPAYRP